MRALPQKEDSSTASIITAYDLSLESGQHEFATDVEITLPRTAGDYDSKVVWYNPDTDQWESLYYEVSDDGLSYRVYMDHFTTVAEVVSNYQVRESGYSTVFHLETTDKNGEAYPKLQQPVGFNDEDAKCLFKSDYAVLDEIITSGGITADTALIAGLSTLNTVVGYSDFANTALSLDKSLSYAGKLKLSGAFTAIGATLTLTRLGYQLKTSGNTSEVWANNAIDLSGAALSVGAVVAGTVSSALISSALSVGALTLFAYNEVSYYADRASESNAEKVYREYLNSRTNYKGEKLTLDGDGWADEIRHILEENQDHPAEASTAIETLYDSYVNKFWDEFTENERVDFYQNSLSDVWRAMELSNTDGVDHLYSDTWVEPDAAKVEYIKDKTKAILIENTKSIMLAVSETFMHESVAKTKDEIYNTVLPYLNQVISIYIKDTGLEKGQHFCDSPYASVEGIDVAFSDASPFSLLPEYAEMWTPTALNIGFTDTMPVTFWPSNYTVDDFNLTQFIPHSVKGSDGVFVCRMYNYMQIGCPTNIVLRGDGTEEHPEIKLSFTLPNAKGGKYIDVNMTIENNSSDLVYVLDTTVYQSHYEDQSVSYYSDPNAALIPDGEDDTDDTIHVGNVILESDITLTENEIIRRQELADGSVNESTVAYPGNLVSEPSDFDALKAQTVYVYTTDSPDRQTIIRGYSTISSCVGSMNEGDVVCIVVEGYDLALRYVCMSQNTAEAHEVNHIDGSGWDYGVNEEWK